MQIRECKLNYSIFVIGDYEDLRFLFMFEKQICPKGIIVDVTKKTFLSFLFWSSVPNINIERIIKAIILCLRDLRI